MRRILIVLALVCGFGLPLSMQLTNGAAQETGVPVSFTVHKAFCPIDHQGGFYEACHDNVVEGSSFTIDGLEIEPVTFVTDAAGVGVAQILGDVSAATEVTLTEDALTLSTLGSYAYCSDQISGFVLFDGVVPEGGVISLGAISTSQEIICDWFSYVEAGSIAGPPAPTEVANG